jgi:ariadne-1
MKQEPDLNHENIYYDEEYQDYQDYQEYYNYEDSAKPEDKTTNSNSNTDNITNTIILSDIQLSKSNPSFEILNNSEIDKLRDNFITEAMEFTSLNKPDAILALIYFNWNLEKLKDTWFEEDPVTGKYLELSGIKQTQTLIVYNNTKEILSHICLVCFSPSTTDTPFSSLSCNHKLCTSCWKDYLKLHINMWNHRQALSTKCPQQNCNLTLPENFVKNFLTQSPSVLKSFQIIIRKNFIHFNQDIKCCPNYDCEVLIKCESKSNKEISCPNCSTNFCNKCLKEGHRPCQCEMIKTWENKNLSEREVLSKVVPNTKPCPKCKLFIEKSQGCDHMTCRIEARGCGYEFCWICLKNWKGHNFACNVFRFEEHKQIEEKKLISSIDYEKYLHYFKRYNNHNEALRLANVTKEFINDSINSGNNFNFNFIESEIIFLKSAIDSVIKSRRLLKYSYIFGYYLFNECSERLLYEHIQSKLESNADRLHELLEGKYISDILTKANKESGIYNLEEFRNFRKTVIDLSNVIDTFSENFLNEIENNMLHLVDYKKVGEDY